MTCAHTASCTLLLLRLPSVSVVKAASGQESKQWDKKQREWVWGHGGRLGGGSIEEKKKRGYKSNQCGKTVMSEKSKQSSRTAVKQSSARQPSAQFSDSHTHAHARTHTHERQLIGRLCWTFSKLE